MPENKAQKAIKELETYFATTYKEQPLVVHEVRDILIELNTLIKLEG